MIHPNIVKRVSAYLLVVLFVFMNLSTSVFAVLANGDDALDQIGQPDFDTGTSGTGADEFNQPWYVELDTVNHRLFVSENFNRRVQVYNLDDSNNFLASKTAFVTLGQDFTASNTIPSSPDATNIGFPSGLAFDSKTGSERLFVSDEDYHRVLVYDVSTARLAGSGSGYSADAVLGQTDFVTGSSGATESKFLFPEGTDYDSENKRLFVTDNSNHRILVFDVATIVNGESATAVIGQDNFLSATAGTTPDKLNDPYNVLYDGANARLFVADSSNNRVMVYSASAAKLAVSLTGMNANAVIGQANFATVTTGTTSSTFSYPAGLAYNVNDDLLAVGDNSNNRVMIFDASTITNGEPAINVLGQPDFETAVGATDIATLNNPWSMVIDPVSNSLFVVDYGNNRVMQFDISLTADVPEFSTTVFSLVLLVLGFAIIQKNGGFKKLMGAKA